MGLYSYRVRVVGGEWSRWADWSTTSSTVLTRESASGGPTRTRAKRTSDIPEGQMPIVTRSRLVIDYDQPITPPGYRNTTGSTGIMSPDQLDELLDEMNV